MKTPKDGSKWSGSDGKKFYVISTVWVDDHNWVYYKSLDNGTEYSCYLESFVERFRELPE
jgi:hypothetical protein